MRENMKKKKLIITEKPSVAIDFVKALGKFQKKDGYFENDEYIISWAVGHLVELFSPPDYDEKYKKWDLKILPVIPDKFQYKIIDKTRKQFEVLKKLINRRDVEFIINAGDAGREGELIQRLIYRLANNKKPVKRFWTSLALTPEVIRQGLKNLRDSKEFDNLFYSGQTRQIMDWLIGMNGTMSVTSKIGKELFSVGRVQTAVLYLLYKRYMEIKNFTPEKYFQLYLILEKVLMVQKFPSKRPLKFPT